MWFWIIVVCLIGAISAVVLYDRREDFFGTMALVLVVVINALIVMSYHPIHR